MAEPRSLGVADAVVTAMEQTPSGRRQQIHYGRRWWRGDGVQGIDVVGKLIISPIPLDETADARQATALPKLAAEGAAEAEV